MQADLNRALLGPLDGTVFAVHVQLDAVVDDLSRYVDVGVLKQLLDRDRPEFPHFPALDADGVVMAMIGTGKAIEGIAVHQGELADHSLLEEKLDGAIYGCLAYPGQLLTEGLDGKALLLLLQKPGHGFPWSGGLVASVFKRRHQFCAWPQGFQLEYRLLP